MSKGEFRGHQRRNGDESGSDSSPFCCFSNGSTLLLIHSGGTAVSGVHPVERVPQVSFLTILSIVGAEGWAINRDSRSSAGVHLNSSIRTIETSRDGRERITTFALFHRQTLKITLANYRTLRQPDLSYSHRMVLHRLGRRLLVHSKKLRLEHSKMARSSCRRKMSRSPA
jgi:hypothetical protein